MDFGKINRGGKTRKQIKQDRKDVAVGIGKELALVGIYAVKEFTGVDIHRQRQKKRQSWQKKWGGVVDSAVLSKRQNLC